MTVDELEAFTWELKQTASAYPGRWFWDEGTPGAFFVPLQRYSLEVACQALIEWRTKHREPPTPYDLTECARLIDKARLDRIARTNTAPVSRQLTASAPPTCEEEAQGVALKARVAALREARPDLAFKRALWLAMGQGLGVVNSQGIVKDVGASTYKPKHTQAECLARIATEAAEKAARCAVTAAGDPEGTELWVES